MQKITELPYISPRCACGRLLPKGRKKQCYICLPPKSQRDALAAAIESPAEPDLQAMTPAEIIADARSRGLSYGKYVAILHDGLPLPPRIHRYEPPIGSGKWWKE